jgi:hypothetical protein
MIRESDVGSEELLVLQRVEVVGNFSQGLRWKRIGIITNC